MLPNGPSWVLRSAHCWVGGRHAAGLMNTHDWHALLRIIRVPIGDGELRGVNRVAVEKKKIGGSGRKGRNRRRVPTSKS